MVLVQHDLVVLDEKCTDSYKTVKYNLFRYNKCIMLFATSQKVGFCRKSNGLTLNSKYEALTGAVKYPRSE